MAEETEPNGHAKRLTAAFVRTARPGFWADGDGLYLDVDGDGPRWAFVSQRGGKRRQIGLGSARTVSLARARELAHEVRETIQAGRNPIPNGRRQRSRKRPSNVWSSGKRPSRSQGQPEWRNAKHRAQWRMTLEVLRQTALERLPVADVDTEAVLSVLQPLWMSRPETAARLRRTD